MGKAKKILLNGILNENPTFRLVLGMCPTLAVTTAAVNGVGMGLAATFVLICSNFVVSLLKDFIPSKVRIPAYVVIIATFVTIVQMVMQAFVPSLYEALGIFIPLIVVNCIILARAEAFASKNTPVASIFDGLGIGLGFTLSLTLVASIRELLGNGTLFGLDVMNGLYGGICRIAGAIFGIEITGAVYQPELILILAPGGFITLGLVLALINKITSRIESRKGRA